MGLPKYVKPIHEFDITHSSSRVSNNSHQILSFKMQILNVYGISFKNFAAKPDLL